MEVEQLVLPQQCRGTILTLVHSKPLSGHLGKDKTVRHVFQRFYCTKMLKPTVNRVQGIKSLPE